MKTTGRFVRALALLGAVACSKTRAEFAYVAIVPAFETRVTALDFEQGDCIGLSIVRASGTYAENVPMTYDGTLFSGGPMWYAERQEPSTLTAYYPYSDEGRPSEFSVAADQRAGCAASDLLGAVSGDVLPTAGPVKMVFRHLLSRLTVVVNNRAGAAVRGVALSGFSPTARVDWERPEATAVPASGGEVQACEAEAGVSYRAILVPQCADLTVAVALTDGSVFRKAMAGTTLEGGKSYLLTVDVAADGLLLGLSGEIRDWVDGGTISETVGGGDAGSGDTGNGDKETADALDYEGVRYRTQTLGGKVWMAENLRYMPQHAALGSGVWYPKEGASAVAAKGLLYDRAAAVGSDGYAAGAPVRGICPPGWHIPDREELEALVAAECPADFFVDAGCWIVGATAAPKYGSSSYLMSATLADDSTMECLKTGTSSILSVPVAYGVSVRCVRD